MEENKVNKKKDYSKIENIDERYKVLEKDSLDLMRKKKNNIKQMAVRTLKSVLEDRLNDIVEKPTAILKRLQVY